MSQYTYFDALNMSRALYGLQPIQWSSATAAGYANANDVGLWQTVGGGTALVVGLPLAFKGTKAIAWDFPKWAYKNYGNYQEAFNFAKANWKEAHYGYAANVQRQMLLKNVKGSGFINSFRNINNFTNFKSLKAQIPQEIKFNQAYYNELKAKNVQSARNYKKGINAAKKKADCYKEAKQQIEALKTRLKRGEFKKNPKAFAQEIQKLENSIGKGNKALETLAAQGRIRSGSKLAKFMSGLKKYSGAKAASNALSKGVQSSSKILSTTCKGAKGFIKGGGAATAAIEFCFEVPEIVKTFRECGSSAGWKQIGKSATVAVASGAGYAAGAWAGGKLGAAAGTAIGTAFPGIGNAVGAVVGGIIGVACGLATSWVAAHFTKKALGKSELEKKKAAEANNTAQEAFNNPQKMSELVTAYESMINSRENMLNEGLIEDSSNQQTANTQVTPTTEQTSDITDYSSTLNDLNKLILIG